MRDWLDTHCHLQLLDDAVAAVTDAADAGVARLVCVGIDAATSQVAVEAAQRNPGVWATVGLHPNDADAFDAEWERLCALVDAGGDRVVGIGECGFDFYRQGAPTDVQERAFRAQIALAKERDLALVIHTRDAWDATLPLLEAVGAPERTVFHCFQGDVATARRCAELGAYVSIAGPVSYPKNDELRAAARAVPLDRIVVETDAPFLSPQRFRGKPNAPARVAAVGEALAEALGRDADEVAAFTTANAERLFGLPARA